MTIYIIFDEKPAGEGYCKGFTSLKGLAGYVGIPYGTLLNHFTREGKRWRDYPGKGIRIIRVDEIVKGKQRFVGKSDGLHDRNI
ncbi:MAG: hypothetical protein DRI97_00025 [Bacteroidetes bacterium]|nr:MAG: hypothetical protein DRI97_00025 [Bacteroidota bacterium]